MPQEIDPFRISRERFKLEYQSTDADAITRELNSMSHRDIMDIFTLANAFGAERDHSYFPPVFVQGVLNHLSYERRHGHAGDAHEEAEAIGFGLHIF